MKDQSRFPPLADTTGKLKAFGTCSCMECPHSFHALPFPGQSALGCCEHTPPSTTANYSSVVDSRLRLPTFERGSSKTEYMYPQRWKLSKESSQSTRQRLGDFDAILLPFRSFFMPSHRFSLHSVSVIMLSISSVI